MGGRGKGERNPQDMGGRRMGSLKSLVREFGLDATEKAVWIAQMLHPILSEELREKRRVWSHADLGPDFGFVTCSVTM